MASGQLKGAAWVAAVVWLASTMTLRMSDSLATVRCRRSRCWKRLLPAVAHLERGRMHLTQAPRYKCK